MNMNTLIVYATKHGSAERCAEMLSQKLTDKAYIHNLKEGSIPELSQYDKVIIGGSIYAGRIQKEVTEFCTKNLNVLKGKKIGLFICCMNKDSEKTQLNSSFPQELLGIAAAKDSFGGEFKFSEMSFMEKTITKMISKMLSKSDPSLPPLDMKNNMSMLSEDAINHFAQLLNSVK
jgi:menaquinone-dependent protoporphyrinogen oxidase